MDQHYVAGLGATRKRELVAIFRPGEVEDLASGKIRELFGRAAVEGLCPDIRDTLLVSNVGQVAPVLGPVDYGITRKAGGRIVKRPRRLAASEGNHADFGRLRQGIVIEGNPLPIRRNSRIG